MWHETNTYSSRPATIAEFEAYELLEGDSIIEHHEGTESVIGGFIDAAVFDLVPTFSAGSWPCGPAPREAAEDLLRRLDTSLAETGPLDGLLVNLHGAMVADGHPDMEADTLSVIRKHFPSSPVVAVLDLHANPSVDLVERSNVVISYDTYPHVDMFDRGREAVALLERLIGGEQLRTRIGKHPLLTVPLAQATDDEPMSGLVAFAATQAAERGVERVCITAGFSYADVDRAGLSVLATASKTRGRQADALIADVLAKIDELSSEFDVSLPGPRAAVTEAAGRAEQPVVLADLADNIGGGSSGDGTTILAEMLEQGVHRGLAVIADAEVAAAAHRAGVDGRVECLLGGKTDDIHGPPIPFVGKVVALSDGIYTSRGSWGAGLRVDQGKTAWIDVSGNDILVTEYPRPPFHVEQVTHIGIDPAAASMIVAKGAVAWKAAYGDIAASVIEVDAPGACPVDLSRLPRSSTPVRVP